MSLELLPESRQTAVWTKSTARLMVSDGMCGGWRWSVRQGLYASLVTHTVRRDAQAINDMTRRAAVVSYSPNRRAEIA